jgi:hypothetical protein
MRYPADPPTIEEIVSVTRTAGVSLKGACMGPPTGLVLEFAATFVVEIDWKGRGSFSYGSHHVNDVPVRPH